MAQSPVTFSIVPKSSTIGQKPMISENASAGTPAMAKSMSILAVAAPGTPGRATDSSTMVVMNSNNTLPSIACP